MKLDPIVETLIENHIPMVKHLARHFSCRLPPVVQLDDLIQAGMIGLIEAAKHSGTLITASLAARSGRDVLAVPNDIFSLTSEGCFVLIKQGAKTICNAEDIEEDYQKLFPKAKKVKNNDPLLDFLAVPKHIDEVAKFLSKSSSNTLSKLSELELDGKLKNLGNSFYQKI